MDFELILDKMSELGRSNNNKYFGKVVTTINYIEEENELLRIRNDFHKVHGYTRARVIASSYLSRKDKILITEEANMITNNMKLLVVHCFRDVNVDKLLDIANETILMGASASEASTSTDRSTNASEASIISRKAYANEALASGCHKIGERPWKTTGHIPEEILSKIVEELEIRTWEERWREGMKVGWTDKE